MCDWNPGGGLCVCGGQTGAVIEQNISGHPKYTRSIIFTDKNLH